MPLRTDRDDADRYQIRPPPLWHASTGESSVPVALRWRGAQQRKVLHRATPRAVVPPRKSHSRDPLSRISNSLSFPVIGWKSQLSYPEPCRKALLVYPPIGRHFGRRERPDIKSRNHEGLIPGQINHRADPECANELSPPYRSLWVHYSPPDAPTS